MKYTRLYFSPENGSGGGSTGAASEGASTDSVTDTEGAAVDGAATGSQADVVQITAERDRIEAERREIQSERDRLRQEIAKLKEPAKQESTDVKPLQADDVMRLLRRERELGQALPTLREEFKYADPAIFQSADEFDTVEALRAAVESSDASRKAWLESLDVVPKSEFDALRQKYVDKYGDLGDTPPDPNGGTPGGLKSAAELAAMSMSQFEAFVAEHGEDAVNRILRSAQEG